MESTYRIDLNGILTNFDKKKEREKIGLILNTLVNRETNCAPWNLGHCGLSNFIGVVNRYYGNKAILGYGAKQNKWKEKAEIFS